jgi:transmembrane sensor
MTSTVTPQHRLRLEEAGLWCVRLSEGDLPPAERMQLDAWLSEDDANRRAFDEAVRAWQGVEQASLQPETIDYRKQALDSFQRANRSRWSHRLARQTGWAAAIAAGLVLVCGVGVWAWMQPHVYETGVGERRVVMLDDGSRLSMDAATRVAVRYHGDRRDIALEQGRAKFDVAKDTYRPFTVRAADKVVVATGTAFSVELLRRDVHVILYEGRVSVLSEPKGGKPAAIEAPLTPGRELIARIAAPSARVVSADRARSLSWEAGQLVFVDEPLDSAVERVNRYSSRKLEIGDTRAGSVEINGVYSTGDVDAFIEGVTAVSRVKVSDGRTFVASAR